MNKPEIARRYEQKAKFVLLQEENREMVSRIVKNYLTKAASLDPTDSDRSQMYYKKAYEVCKQGLGKDHMETKRIYKLIMKKPPSLINKITLVTQIEEMKEIKKSRSRSKLTSIASKSGKNSSMDRNQNDSKSIEIEE